MKLKFKKPNWSKRTWFSIISIIGFIISSLLADFFEEIIFFRVLLVLFSIASVISIIPLIAEEQDLSKHFEEDYNLETKKDQKIPRFKVEDVDYPTSK